MSSETEKGTNGNLENQKAKSRPAQNGKPEGYANLWDRWGIDGLDNGSRGLEFPGDFEDENERDENRRDRAIGSIVGLAVGDALGATVECAWTEDIYVKYGPQGQTEMRGGGPWKLAIGEYTDDTAMMLCLLESLLVTNRRATARPHGLDVNDLGQRFVKWKQSKPKDIGRTVYRALERIEQGVEPILAGDPDPDNQANGAVMRCAPVAVLWHLPSQSEALVRDSLLSAYPTHRSPLSSYACVLVNTLIARLIEDYELETALSRAKEVAGQEWLVVLDQWEAEGRPHKGNAGWVVATVLTALHCVLTTASFEEAVVKAVNGGRDADTVGAVTGTIAGALYGESAIPTRWTEVLKDYNKMRAMAEELFQPGEGEASAKL